jgi:mutator protein MutT
MITKDFTLCLIHQDNKILLGMKKRGFGAGRWNGFGGKIHEGETIEEAAIREFREESTIEINELEQRGTLHFQFTDKMNEELRVTIFAVTKWQGEPMETEEMKPQWFDISAIPYDTMWPDDRVWLPLFLAGKKFQGSCIFDHNHVMLRHTIVEEV